MSQLSYNGSNDESAITHNMSESSINQEINETLHRVSNNGHSEIKYKGSEHLPDVNLDLSFNNVSSLESLRLFDWTSAPMIKMLNLSHNQIENLNSSHFQSLYNLVILDLSSNVIDAFTLAVFRHLSSLKYLYLHNNRIANIVLQPLPGDLPFIPSLAHLDLSHNRLLSLPARTFSRFPELSSLNMTDNTITTIDDFAFAGLPRLQVLSLSQNNISNLDYPVFQNTSLVMLWLDKMPHLSSLGHNAFKGLTHLQYLNLSHNSQLRFLHHDILSGLQSLQILDLSDNAIQKLSSLTFRSNLQLHNVYLKGLPLICQCTNAWLVDHLHNNNSFFHNASSLTCIDTQTNQSVPIADATFTCNNVSIPDIQNTLSVPIGSTLTLQCKQGFSEDDVLIWTTPRGYNYYYHDFHPNASQHLPSPKDVQPNAPFHKSHYWHDSSSYYPDLDSYSDRINLLSDGSLFIDYVLRTDAGSYRCLVKNMQYNDSGTMTVHLTYHISGEIKITACIVGILCALAFFTLNVIYVVISWIARRLVNKRRREHIRQMLENLNSYKSTQITRIYENYSGQLTRVRNRYHVQRDRLHKNYTMQVERVKRGCSHQAEKVKDNYNNRLNQLREYSSSQIMQIREMATNQIGRIRDYGSLQLDRLRETYKLQHQHMMKLLDTMNLDNCRSIVETECMRTESMMYDLDLLSQDDVRIDSPFSIADADSEYNTATSSPMLSVGSQEFIDDPCLQVNHIEAGDQYETVGDKYFYVGEDTGESEEVLKVTRNKTKSEMGNMADESAKETTDDIQIEMNTVLHLPDNVQLDAKEVWTYGQGDESTHTLYTKMNTPEESYMTNADRGGQSNVQICEEANAIAGVSLPCIDLDMIQQSEWDMGYVEQEASPVKLWQGPPPLFHGDDFKDCAAVNLYDADEEEEEEEEEEKTETDTMV